ncbi:MAG: hypothetical protein GX430_07060 [Treponema sp.]|nr:hypothetical protein [Treponema sp.]
MRIQYSRVRGRGKGCPVLPVPHPPRPRQASRTAVSGILGPATRFGAARILPGL